MLSFCVVGWRSSSVSGITPGSIGRVGTAIGYLTGGTEALFFRTLQFRVHFLSTLRFAIPSVASNAAGNIVGKFFSGFEIALITPKMIYWLKIVYVYGLVIAALRVTLLWKEDFVQQRNNFLKWS